METKGLAKNGNPEKFQHLLARGIAALLGVEPSEEIIEKLEKEIKDNSSWYQFICKNKIHYITHSQQLEFNSRLVGMICVNGRWFNWDQFACVQTDDGYLFSINEQISFKTDENYKLKEYCYYGNNGVVPGTLQQADGLTNFFKRPASKKYWLSVYTHMKDPFK